MKNFMALLAILALLAFIANEVARAHAPTQIERSQTRICEGGICRWQDSIRDVELDHHMHFGRTFDEDWGVLVETYFAIDHYDYGEWAIRADEEELDAAVQSLAVFLLGEGAVLRYEDCDPALAAERGLLGWHQGNVVCAVRDGDSVSWLTVFHEIAHAVQRDRFAVAPQHGRGFAQGAAFVLDRLFGEDLTPYCRMVGEDCSLGTR